MGILSPKLQRSRDGEHGILPLINIVFLLLIFFMLAGKLATFDPFEIAPPHSVSEGPSGGRNLIVLVAADGRLALDGEEMPETALGDAVADWLAEWPASRVQLKADAGSEATLVVAVMERLRDAGVDHLQLLTVPELR